MLRALEVLKALAPTRKRTLPENTPLECIPKRYLPFVEQETQVNRKAYECAVITVLRDEIRRGNIWVKDSKRYTRLDDFFIANTEWDTLREAFFRKAGLPLQKDEVKPYLTKKLNGAYTEFLDGLPDNTYVRIEADGWSFGSDSGEDPEQDVEEKRQAFENWLGARLRTIRLPDLLIEVDNELRYTRPCCTALKVPERHPEEVCRVIAAIMAYGCNIGPYTMARLTKGISYEEIQHIADWGLQEETLRSALAEVVNAIAALETTNVWGQGRTSSSDGQRFAFPRKVLQRTWSHRLSDFAMEFYSFVADNYAPFYAMPIECTDRDAAFVLDGLLYHESDLEIEEHYTDTHGYTEINFAAFAMLGKRFCPRIRGLHHQWIYRIDPHREYGPLAPLVARGDRTIHLDWICDQWDRMGHFYASLQRGHTTASVALKRLMAYGGRNEFYRANRELGRIFKTEFILQYLSTPELRRRIHRGLLKGEQLHALARNVHYGKQGKTHIRDFHQQMSTASCLILILACIIYWQAREITRVMIKEPPEDHGLDPALLAHLSPIAWDNILLYGQYVLNPSLVR